MLGIYSSKNQLLEMKGFSSSRISNTLFICVFHFLLQFPVSYGEGEAAQQKVREVADGGGVPIGSVGKVPCHFLDGTPLKGPCPTPVHLSTNMESWTDTEVEDLTSHTPRGGGDRSRRRSSTVEPPWTPEAAVLGVDSLTGATSLPLTASNSRYSQSLGGPAAVLALSLSALAYLAVVLWRRNLMNGFQNRELLLNDEDIGDINDEDMRHFEAACIQIEP